MARRAMVVAIAVVVVIDLVLAAGATVGPRPVRSYLTHWEGSPTHTEPYGPYPVDGEPIARLVAVGDLGVVGGRLDVTARGVAKLASKVPIDALLLLGDNAYPRGDPDTLADTVFGPFGEVLDGGARLLAILGNHDVMDGHAAAQVAALGMPGRWWATEIAGVLVVGLDSTEADDATQRAWLEETLRASTARWRIVALHHPPYSAGYQGSSHDVRNTFGALFERYGVQLVLSGHDHDYQRSEPIGGVTYVVSGAAAVSRRTGREWFTDRSFSWHHFVEVTVFDDAIVVRAINQDLRVADEATIAQ